VKPKYALAEQKNASFAYGKDRPEHIAAHLVEAERRRDETPNTRATAASTYEQPRQEPPGPARQNAGRSMRPQPLVAAQPFSAQEDPGDRKPESTKNVSGTGRPPSVK